MSPRRKKRSHPDWLYDLAFLVPPEAAHSDHYYYVTQRPWPSLLFVLPLLMIVEIGTALQTNGHTLNMPQLVATYLLDWMINLFGRSAFYLPGLLVVVILLASHIAAKQSWKFDPWVLPGMLGESLLTAIPLFVFNRVLHTAIVATQGTAFNAHVNNMILGLGAGIYEELVFRLIAITGLMILLVNILNLPRGASAIVAVMLSSAVFAGLHHPPLGAEPFKMLNFLFRTAAGMYLAGLFVFRGFGIACGCHAFYNVVVLGINAMQT